jgi:chromosome segregation ATPase
MKNLSPFINIIAGPNASGKSSTARAIQKLLWQNRTNRITASGQFKIDGESWLSEVDSSYSRFQKGGINKELKGIPSEEEQSRYMLSLHDLIREEESDLAENILKDAIGGYDIDKAKNNLGYSDSKKKTNTSQFRAHKEAREEVNKITENQKKLQGDQNRLEELEEEKKKAKKAEEQTVFYKLVQSFKEKQKSLQDIREQLSEFPDKMKWVKEDDCEKFDEYLDEIRHQGKAIEGFETDIEELKEKKSELKLPETGVESLDLSKAENYLEELAELEKIIRDAKREIAKATSDLEEASTRLGLEADASDFEGLDAEAISKTEQFWQNGFDLIGKKRELEKQLIKLKGQQEKAPDSETIVVGVSALSNWLSRYSSPVKPVSNCSLAFY